MIQLRSNVITLLGDTHSYQGTYYALNYKLSKQSCDVVFLGDGGEGFSSERTDFNSLANINELCRERGIYLYYLRGNHTNPNVWRRGYEFSHLLLVDDYTEARFPNQKTALLVGGGVSIDRFSRTRGRDYWTDEITPYKKMEKQFDFLIAHDCPDYFNHSTASLVTSPYAAFLRMDKTLLKDALAQRTTMDKIVADIQPKKCFSGHFHNNLKEMVNNIEYRCVDINELYEFNSNE